jgi:predicted small secreted protein
LSWKKFIFGITVGAATTFLIQSQVNKEYISAEKALKLVKDTFKKDGPIEGSWINTERETYTENDVVHTVYRGGVSKRTDDELNHYNFVMNAKTGTLISVTKDED